MLFRLRLKTMLLYFFLFILALRCQGAVQVEHKRATSDDKLDCNRFRTNTFNLWTFYLWTIPGKNTDLFIYILLIYKCVDSHNILCIWNVKIVKLKKKRGREELRSHDRIKMNSFHAWFHMLFKSSRKLRRRAWRKRFIQFFISLKREIEFHFI